MDLDSILERADVPEDIKEEIRRMNLICSAIGEAMLAIFTSDIEGNVTYANPAAARMWGFKDSSEMMGTSVRDYWVEANRADVEKVIQELFQKGVYSGEGLVGKRRDGSEFLVAFNALLVKDSSGKPIGMNGSFEDITERKKTEMNLMQSEKKFRSLVEATSDWIWEVDPNGKYTYTSPKVKEMLGYDPEEIIGKTPFDLMPPDEARRVGAEFADFIESKKAFYNLENVNLHKDGKCVVIETSGVPIFDADGNLSGYRGIDRDITERKQAENALLVSESKYRLLVDSLNEGIWQIDENGLTTFVNPRMAEMLGYPVPEMMGKHLFDFMDEQGKSIAEANIERRKRGIKEQHDFVFIRKDGRRIYSLIETSPIMDKNGKYLGALAGVQDITERKNLEKALLERERLSAIGELAAGVAHDFNNALQSILGNLELALIESITPEARDYLETAKKSSIDAAARIKQVQRFAGKRTETMAYALVKINSVVADAVAQSRHLWKDESERQGVAIDIKATCADDLTVLGNDAELRSVLYNLLKNSVQAMPQGGTITIGTRREGNDVYLTVTDTGLGMDENTKMKIFQPFFTTKGYEQGRGLGMSSVYAVINEHKGQVYVKRTAPGEGTSIEIVFPYAEGSPVSGEKPESVYEGSARVLWVDDEEPIRKMGGRVLKSLGHTADVAGSGQEALELLAKGQYDLMITDVGMQGMSGWQLAEKIKGMYPGMKVAVVSGWGGGDVTDEQRSRYGVGYILGKPVSSEQLGRLVGEVLQMKQK